MAVFLSQTVTLSDWIKLSVFLGERAVLGQGDTVSPMSPTASASTRFRSYPASRLFAHRLLFASSPYSQYMASFTSVEWEEPKDGER